MDKLAILAQHPMCRSVEVRSVWIENAKQHNLVVKDFSSNKHTIWYTDFLEIEEYVNALLAFWDVIIHRPVL